MDAHLFLAALATVLGVAAVTTVVFQRFGQPVVLGYILAGLIIGPHVPIPLVADPAIIRTLSEIGVILLMFSLGLEFRLKKLREVASTAGVTAVLQCSLMMWLGYGVGRAFGWTPLESVFTGALIAISSTTIIAKAFDEQRVKGRLREIVIGILIVEDLIAIVLMTTLTAVSTGSGLSAGDLAGMIGRLLAFLAGLLVVGMMVIPRAMRSIVALGRPETTLIAAIGICFGISLLALEAGYSVALGAFLAGSLVAESGEEAVVEPLVQPVKDVFAAVFFVSVGMLIVPDLVVEHLAPILALTVVVVFGKIAGVAVGAFLTGNGTRRSIEAGMSLAQIGEFSFIIAGLGLALGAARDFLYPVAVTVSAITTLLTPWLIRASGPVGAFVDRRLPPRLQTFIVLYGSWIEDLRHSPDSAAPSAGLRRPFGLLLLDAALLAGIVVAASLWTTRFAAWLEREGDLPPAIARGLVIAAFCALSAPFCVGIVQISRRLGAGLAERAMPTPLAGRLDLAAAPRRMLVVTLQLACVLFVGVPLVAVTQPFVPALTGAGALLLVLLLLAPGFWSSAGNLQGHVRAGAQAILEVLAAQSRPSSTGHDDAREAGSAPDFSTLRELLPGIGEPVALRVPADSPAVGRSLAALNLRGRSGATVLAIGKAGGGTIVPEGRVVLGAGDVLAIAGTAEAIEAARDLLEANPTRLATSHDAC